MASRVNSDFAYINLINGETVWERLRIVRNFLEDRKIAKTLQKTQKKKREALEAKIEEATLRSAKLMAEAELEEFDAHEEQMTDGYQKLDDELKFLTEYEKELALIAEQTRVPGTSDDEMYQINMHSEVVMRNLRKIETERVAGILGCSPSTADEAMKVPGMRQQMLNTANAMALQAPATATPEERLGIEALRTQLIQAGLDFSKTPLTVQEELQLNQKLLIGYVSTQN